MRMWESDKSTEEPISAASSVDDEAFLSALAILIVFLGTVGVLAVLIAEAST